MKTKRLLLVALLAASASARPLRAGAEETKMPAAGPEVIRVLWIGNSYTGVNDLPGVVGAMVNATGGHVRGRAADGP